MNQQYLTLCKQILAQPTGADRSVGTKKLVGAQLRYDSFPLVSCKAVDPKKVTGELLWMISGSTDTKDLHKPEFGSVHYWDENAAEFARRRGLNPQYSTDIGRSYGWAWTKGFGFNQLELFIERAAKNPFQRDIMLTNYVPNECPFYNPAGAALTPCVMNVHLVANDKLNFVIHQRSCDVLLGLPANAAQYWVLLEMTALCLKNRGVHMPVGQLVHNMDDCHIYTNHIETVEKMIAEYEVKPEPTMKIIDRGQLNLADFTLNDFEFTYAEAKVFRGKIN